MAMKGIVADADILGQFRVLVRKARGPAWVEVWDSLNIAVETFQTLGLAADAPDAEVWRCCQSRELVLVTGNRNADGPEALEVTIRNENTPTSLPVLTISRPGQIDYSDAYAERVVESLLERLLRIEQLRGTGRLYIP
jgi:hypothetical protein